MMPAAAFGTVKAAAGCVERYGWQRKGQRFRRSKMM